MADVPLNEESSDWLGWWETVKQHFPSLFDGTGPLVGQAVAEGGEAVVRNFQRLEVGADQLETNVASIQRRWPAYESRLANNVERIADRRARRQRIVASLVKFSS